VRDPMLARCDLSATLPASLLVSRPSPVGVLERRRFVDIVLDNSLPSPLGLSIVLAQLWRRRDAVKVSEVLNAEALVGLGRGPGVRGRLKLWSETQGYVIAMAAPAAQRLARRELDVFEGKMF